MTDKTMSDKEYLALDGQLCPYCHSPKIQAGKLYADGTVAWQRVSCDDCGKEWHDQYAMTGWRPSPET